MFSFSLPRVLRGALESINPESIRIARALVANGMQQGRSTAVVKRIYLFILESLAKI